YAVLGDLDQELHTYQVWEQTYPRDWTPWENSAVDLEFFGDYDRALPQAQEALRLNPDHARCYFHMALGFLFQNRKDEAKEIMQQALKRGLDVAGFHIALYQVAFLEGDTKKMQAQVAALAGKPGEDSLLNIQSNTEAYLKRVR